MRNLNKAGVFGLTLAAAVMSSALWADDNSPVGLWQNIDDVSGKPRALIRITEPEGVLKGVIEKAFPTLGESQNPKCVKCEGVNKNAPIVGLTILTGLRKDGEEYTDGQILDPDNGKVYSSKATLSDEGKKLNVRGYIGLPVLGRSQTWIRQE
ncbi:DUF2147 domain-containing protein [Pseudomonas sp. PCH199]|uniref:DUF2147 domain-containing protein n=1 Tax=unclassified Pseudomonas TaxID=196821 RepID=UPI000BDA8ADF|nr:MULTISPECIES: DUF2147 domain-containing protein [unclassified Pseudomonas]MCW8279214.1 DUF2147 domain-containing protein [Pseudomonas sp. PCH199]PAM78517.1 hypothetical protein CES87_30910 [Pseudomonas sp. ERMR1:02]